MSKTHEVSVTRLVTLDQLIPNYEFNIRNTYEPGTDPEREEATLDQLADSIKRNGLITPLLVRPHANDGQYEIISGYRRFQALEILCKSQGVKPAEYKVNVLVRSLDEQEAMVCNLLENTQRSAVRHPDLAKAFNHMTQVLGLSVKIVAKEAGMSEGYVKNLARAWRNATGQLRKDWLAGERIPLTGDSKAMGGLATWCSDDNAAAGRVEELYLRWKNGAEEEETEETEEADETEESGSKKPKDRQSHSALAEALKLLRAEDKKGGGDVDRRAGQIEAIRWALCQTNRLPPTSKPKK